MTAYGWTDAPRATHVQADSLLDALQRAVRANFGRALLVALVAACGVATAHQVGSGQRPDAWTAPLPGLAPQALLLDADTRRAVVLSARGSGSVVTVVDIMAGRVVRTVDVSGQIDAAALGAGRVLVAHAMPSGSEQTLVLDTRHGDVAGAVAVGPAFPLSGGADALAIDDAGRHAAVLDPTDGTLRLLDVRTATVSRAITVGRGAGAVAVDGRAGHAFVLDRARRRVVLLDLVTGAPGRVIAVGRNPARIIVDEEAGRALVSNLDDGTVSVLDTRDGSVLGTVPAGGGPIAIDARGGRAFVSDTNVPGHVTMLDARRGVGLRPLAAGNLPGQGVVDARTGRVFIPGSSGNSSDTVVTAFDVRTGRAAGSAYLGPTETGAAALPDAAGTLAVDPARGRVYGIAFGRGDGGDANGRAVGAGVLRVLDAHTGAVLRSTTVGVNPLAVAVDGRGGRVIVVDAGGAAPDSDPWVPLRRLLPHWLPLPAPRGARLVPGDVRILDAS